MNSAMPATTFSNGRSNAVEDGVSTKAGETANLTSAVTRPEHDIASAGCLSGNGDHRSDPKHSSHKATNGAYENEDSDIIYDKIHQYINSLEGQQS